MEVIGGNKMKDISLASVEKDNNEDTDPVNLLVHMFDRALQKVELGQP